jgi:transposase
MGKSYSEDVRRPLAKAVSKGQSRRGAAEIFGVSVSTAIRWAKRAKTTGTTAPDVQGRPPGHGKLAPYREFLIKAVEAKPDITLPELAAALMSAHGVDVVPQSLSRFLTKLGFTYKKTADGVGVRARRRR